MNKKKVMAIPGDLFACGNYRIIEPYKKLEVIDHEAISFEVYDYVNRNNTTLEGLFAVLSTYDAVLFQRVFTKEILAMMMALKKIGVKVYMEIDDDLYNVSQTSPAWETWRKGGECLTIFTKALTIADCVHVSTPELVTTYFNKAKDFEIFFNGIDVSNDKYHEKNSRRAELPMDKTVIMWSGSSTHYDSIQEISGVLSQIIPRYKDVLFALCGNKEFLDMIDIPNEQKIFIEPVKMEQYYNIPSMCDIGLTPVKLNKFNDGKSELKCLEHGIWGIPVVSSPAAPYIRFNQFSGANLVAKKNRFINWEQHLTKLIENKAYRKELGEKSRRFIHDFYNLDKINEKRIKFYEKELLSQ